MDTFPSSLASGDPHSPLTEAERPAIEEDGGLITLSHGGLVQGHEFDLPILPSNRPTVPRDPSPLRLTEVANGGVSSSAAARPHQQPPLSTVPQTPSPPEPHMTSQAPRPQTAQPRARPVSMPPPPARSQNGVLGVESMNENRARAFHKDDGVIRSRASGKLLGIYTLTKTLGAGSMGKVKLAINNINGEQVCFGLAKLQDYYDLMLPFVACGQDCVEEGHSDRQHQRSRCPTSYRIFSQSRFQRGI